MTVHAFIHPTNLPPSNLILFESNAQKAYLTGLGWLEGNVDLTQSTAAINAAIAAIIAAATPDPGTGNPDDPVPDPLEPPTYLTIPKLEPTDTDVGVILSVTPGTYEGNPTPVLTYQWEVNHVAVPGATGTTFDTAGLSAGDVVEVIETATNSEGVDHHDSNEVTLT